MVDGLIDTMRTLEESLWRRETRFYREYLESVLAPDCFEFGRSGRTYDRSAMLAIGLPSGDTV